MKEFIEFIAKHLVDSPDQVNVDEKESEDNKVTLSLKVQSDDVGKVIGKQGKTAQAMRTLTNEMEQDLWEENAQCLKSWTNKIVQRQL